MGRASRGKQEQRAQTGRPIKLTTAEFWELRARWSDAENAKRSAHEAIARSNAADARAKELTATLATTHRFDAAAVYSFDDATTSIVQMPVPTTKDGEAGERTPPKH